MAGLDYSIGVHMYAWPSGQPQFPVSPRVRLFCGGRLITTQATTFGLSRDLWLVGSLEFQDDAGCTFAPSGTMISGTQF